MIDLGYTPRKQFIPFHKRKTRWACIVAHRRAGKTVACIADLVDFALRDKSGDARFAYVAPTYVQAKDIAWQYLKEYTAHIPGVIVNESELRVDLPVGSRIRLYGADNYDRMRGLYFDGVVLDEPADMPQNAWPMVIRPALADREGWAVFIGTPKGKNDFYEIAERAKASGDWFFAELKASETGILRQTELDEALATMGRDRYEQEFEVSFDAAVVGAYYGEEMRAATKEGRITRVPYDPALPVITAFDLGIGDSTAIWFCQQIGGENRLIDFYEASGVALDHYVRMLNDRGYIYGYHILPHDVEVKELGTGKSRKSILQELGVRDIRIAPKVRVDDGIQAARLFLKNCWFDSEKCGHGINCLKEYRKEYDEKNRAFKDRPLHNYASHAADAFRYLALTANGSAHSTGPIRRNLRGIA